MEQVGQNFGWDQTITNEWVEGNAGGQKEKREIQDPGNYELTISKVEKKTVKKQGNYTGAPMASIELVIGGTTVYENIILNTDFKTKIANFLKAVFGAENPPQGFWDQLVGRQVKVELIKYKDRFTNSNGEEIEFDKNGIKRFLDKTIEHKMGPFDQSEVKPMQQRQQAVPDFGGSATGNGAQQAPAINNDLPF